MGTPFFRYLQVFLVVVSLLPSATVMAEGQERAVVRKAEPRTQSRQPISIDPTRIDLGSFSPAVGIAGEIVITNHAEAMARWYVELDPKEAVVAANRHLLKTRYLSLATPKNASVDSYTLPLHAEKLVQLYGCWTNTGGYPTSNGTGVALRMDFNGSSVALVLENRDSQTKLSCILDGRQVEVVVPQGGGRGEDEETVVAGNLSPGAHTLYVEMSRTAVRLKGVRIGGVETKRVRGSSVRVMPLGGRVLPGETELVRVSVNTEGLGNGVYSHMIFLNDGVKPVPVGIHFEIVSKEASDGIAVYRYSQAGMEVLGDANVTEEELLRAKGYHRDGVAFTLFSLHTPATVPLKRFVRTATGDRYYCLETETGTVPRGYFYEREIGNIATSKLTDTKPLYRWYNRERGTNIFTTSSDTKILRRRGYIFEKIVGYVK